LANRETDDSGAAAQESARFRLWGFIGQPGVSRSTREDQHLFVNRRPVENRGLNFALIEGYHTALMKGRYPVCCLFLEVDPATVDVNIHPAKREVKFHNERAIRQLTAQAVREALLNFHGGTGLGSSPSASPPAQPATDARGAAPLPTTNPAPFASGPDPVPVPRPSTISSWPASGPAATREFPSFGPLTGTPLAAPVRPGPETSAATRRGTNESSAGVPFVPPGSPATAPTPLAPSGSMASSASSSHSPGEPTPLLNVPLRLVGVIGRLYVVLESDRGLVLMDQHAAHERILFEQMLERVERGDVPCQRLLLPETVELSVRDAQFLREQLPTLSRLGVGLSEFGERTFLLDGLPPMVKASEPRRFVLGLVDELKSAGQQVNAQRLGEHTIAKTVCRHAVKANDPLSGPELEHLVHDLRHCAMPYTCPHGRPTLIEMSYRELEKKFGRQA
jgi:DNA mismatch repair protein MutL